MLEIWKSRVVLDSFEANQAFQKFFYKKVKREKLHEIIDTKKLPKKNQKLDEKFNLLSKPDCIKVNTFYSIFQLFQHQQYENK